MSRLVPIIITFMLFVSGTASALSFSDGRWRLELSGGAALDEGGEDRDGDTMWTGYVDYEMPATEHLTLSLRGVPLYLYEQEEDENDRWWREVFRHDEESADTVWGGGVGLAGRVYQKGQVYSGLFLELEALAIVHNGRIEGDSSSLDFVTGVGVGYHFTQNWLALLRFEHTSNAGLGGDNSGVNTVRAGVGYRF